MPDEPEIIVGDITVLHIDAIVNAANDALLPGGGVCGAIHAVAGAGLEAACAELCGCPTGDARITPGFKLPARYVIHAVGPIYHDGQQGEPEQLASCYRRSLQLAAEHGVDSIAFPCISTGIFGYPIDDAADVALNTIARWLKSKQPPCHIACCCFSEYDAATYRNRQAARSEQC